MYNCSYEVNNRCQRVKGVSTLYNYIGGVHLLVKDSWPFSYWLIYGSLKIISMLLWIAWKVIPLLKYLFSVDKVLYWYIMIIYFIDWLVTLLIY